MIDAAVERKLETSIVQKREAGAKPTRIFELDGLRAIAILLVIGCHYRAFSNTLYGILKFGWIGVDIFFVLSGFLITSILLRMKGAPKALRRFYERRFRRIIPPLVLMLLVIAIGCLVTGDRAFFTPVSLLKNALFLQSFNNVKGLLAGISGRPLTSLSAQPLPLAAEGIAGPLSLSAGILWSLSIEEYFYLLWAPVVLFLSRRAIAIVAFSICLLEFFVRWFCFSGRPDYFSIFYRFDALIYGAIAALALEHCFFKEERVRQWLTTAAVFACTGVITVLWAVRPVLGREIRQSPLFMVLGLPLVSMAVAAVVGILARGAGSRGTARGFLRCWPMRSIGTVSYTLYLVHVFVYLVLTRIFGMGWLGAIVSVAMAILFATVSWIFLESPILSADPRRS